MGVHRGAGMQSPELEPEPPPPAQGNGIAAAQSAAEVRLAAGRKALEAQRAKLAGALGGARRRHEVDSASHIQLVDREREADEQVLVQICLRCGPAHTHTPLAPFLRAESRQDRGAGAQAAATPGAAAAAGEARAPRLPEPSGWRGRPRRAVPGMGAGAGRPDRAGQVSGRYGTAARAGELGSGGR